MFSLHEDKYKMKFDEYLKEIMNEIMPDYYPLVHYENYQADVFKRLSNKELNIEEAENFMDSLYNT